MSESAEDIPAAWNAAGVKKPRSRRPKALVEAKDVAEVSREEVAMRDGTAQPPPPWTGFTEAQIGAYAIPPAGGDAARRRAGEFVLAEGFSYHYCLRNCGNGRYVAGRTYPLRDGQNSTFFRKME